VLERPVSKRDRTITIPELARASRELAATGSEVRHLVPLHAVPWLVITYDELRGLPLDRRAGFVVSLIDGRCSVEMLLDLTGMREDETVDILRQLVGHGAIELRDPKEPSTTPRRTKGGR